MFRQLAQILAVPPVTPVAAANQVLTQFRPSQLSEFLEAFWSQARDPLRQDALADPADLAPALHQAMARPAPPQPGVLDPLVPPVLPPPAPPVVWWEHAVYAALLEQTRIVPIFRRVVLEWLQDERLPHATQATQRWLHATEQLFFASWPYSVRAVTSSLRPDGEAVRRNLYWRLFGWDLQHGSDDGRPYSYLRAEAANRDFSTLFEALLAEVWKGVLNITNLIGPNATDNNAIDTLVRRLQEMLLARRYAGAMSREEFDAVAMLAWFHLTLEYNTLVVQDLAAQAAGMADRLKNIGARVGISAHSRSDAFFQLALPMSNILINIENGQILNLGAPSLYAGQFSGDMLDIITHWSIATGRNIKDPTLRQPLGAVLTEAARANVSQLAGRAVVELAGR